LGLDKDQEVPEVRKGTFVGISVAVLVLILAEWLLRVMK